MILEKMKFYLFAEAACKQEQPKSSPPSYTHRVFLSIFPVQRLYIEHGMIFS
jgi:hypothetical protein